MTIEETRTAIIVYLRVFLIYLIDPSEENGMKLEKASVVYANKVSEPEDSWKEESKWKAYLLMKKKRADSWRELRNVVCNLYDNEMTKTYHLAADMYGVVIKNSW